MRTAGEERALPGLEKCREESQPRVVPPGTWESALGTLQPPAINNIPVGEVEIGFERGK